MDRMKIIQIIIAVALMAVILLQNRGAGLSGVFGGSGNVYLTKRGFEKKLFIATIIISIIFLAISLLAIIL
ncbi:MAG: preprotein translocase subunit SecG [Patescibacteria group bacterium]|nr:preprotein translocase subunit SecG [Patescibacteria group bacterium]